MSPTTDRVLMGRRYGLEILALEPRPGPELGVRYRLDMEGGEVPAGFTLTFTLEIDGLPSGALQVTPTAGVEAELGFRFGRFPPGTPAPDGRYRVDVRSELGSPGQGPQAFAATVIDEVLASSSLVLPAGTLEAAPAPTPDPLLELPENFEPSPLSGHSYTVYGVEAHEDGPDRWRLEAQLVNFGDRAGPPVKARFGVDAPAGVTIPLEPEEIELAPLEPGVEMRVLAHLDLGGLPAGTREELFALTGIFEVDARDGIPEDDSFPWVIPLVSF